MAPLILNRFMEMQLEEHSPMRANKRRRSKQEGILECSNCHAYEIEGRWYSREEVRSHLPRPRMRVPVVGTTTCFACDQLLNKRAVAVVELRGEEWKKQRDLVLHTIQAVADDAMANNNQERVLRESQDADGFAVYMSHPDLARHIGRMLVKRYHGRIEYLRQNDAPHFKAVWWSDDTRFHAPTRGKSVRKPKSRRLRRRGAI